jgi:hypothetical protein
VSLHAQLERAVGAQDSVRWCPHTPHPKQAEFLALECREALYGGAAGGGKSDALLMGALEHVDVPGYNALILRKTFSDLKLPEAIMDRSHEWLAGTKAHWDAQSKQWTFPSGARITFGYLKNTKDRYRYQGAAFQYIAFDELTQFDEREYKYLFSRLRRPKGVGPSAALSKVPLRMRAGSNPGGLGHEWVRERFMVEKSVNRKFVPAKMKDNPSLDQASYRESLSELDHVTRMQLEEGIWEQDPEGMLYSATSFNRWTNDHGIFERRGKRTYLCSLDFGVTNMNAIAVLGWQEHSDVVHVLACRYIPGLADQVAAEHRELNAEFHFSRTIGDIGGLGKSFAGELISRHQIPVQPAQKTDKYGFIKLLNGAFEQRKVVIHTERCGDLVAEYPRLVRTSTGTEPRGVPNHCADAVLYGWRECRAFQSKKAKKTITFDEVIAAEAIEARLLLSGKYKKLWID